MTTTTIRLTQLIPSSRRRQRSSRIILHRFLTDVMNAPRYLFRYLVVVLAGMGLLSIIDAHGDGHVPVFVSLLPPSGIDPARASSRGCTVEGTHAEERWVGLFPALNILDQVNPEVAGWIRERNTAKAIVFSDADFRSNDQCIALAKYDALSGKLTIHRQLFAENDGNIAVILAHEFRHSRQNYSKLFRYALSFLFAKGGDSSIVENDAEIYEREAKVAIFGSH